MLEKMELAKFESIKVEDLKTDEEQCYNMRWLLKLKSQKFRKVVIRNKKRIKDNGLNEVLKKKYEKIEINPETCVIF